MVPGDAFSCGAGTELSDPAASGRTSARVEQEEVVTPGDQEEDSFSQYYSSDIPKNKEKKPAAVKLKGEKLLHADMQITEVIIPVKETLTKARSYGVSITVFLTAMLLCSIHEEIPKNRQKRPIALMIPVNLRNYFPSQSMGNFFGWIEVGYTLRMKRYSRMCWNL